MKVTVLRELSLRERQQKALLKKIGYVWEKNPKRYKIIIKDAYEYSYLKRSYNLLDTHTNTIISSVDFWFNSFGSQDYLTFRKHKEGVKNEMVYTGR